MAISLDNTELIFFSANQRRIRPFAQLCLSAKQSRSAKERKKYTYETKDPFVKEFFKITDKEVSVQSAVKVMILRFRRDI